MQISIFVTRSVNWLKDRRIATGENDPECLEVTVDVAIFSERARRILLHQGNGSYPKRLGNGLHLSYSKWPDGSPDHTSWRAPILIDSADPTEEELEAAIIAAEDHIIAQRMEHIESKTKREAALEAKRLKRKEAEAARDAARELLADDYERHGKNIEKLEARLDLLSRVLHNTRLDAIESAIQQMAENAQEDKIASLAEEVEKASTYHIFFREDED